MKLWTIQTIEWYEKFQADGIIYGSEAHVDKDFILGYKWLMEQMEERIGPKPIDDGFPLWAWYQWNGISQKRPDLRSTSHFNKGTSAVRIEIEKDDKDVLLSDFELWHFPLAYFDYIPSSEEDDYAFERQKESHRVKGLHYMTYPPFMQEKTLKSWEKIFDLEFEDPYVTQKNENKAIQATFWSLSIDEVKKVDKFKSR